MVEKMSRVLYLLLMMFVFLDLLLVGGSVLVDCEIALASLLDPVELL